MGTIWTADGLLFVSDFHKRRLATMREKRAAEKSDTEISIVVGEPAKRPALV